jgi:hypothetical protein
LLLKKWTIAKPSERILVSREEHRDMELFNEVGDESKVIEIAWASFETFYGPSSQVQMYFCSQ